MNNAPIMSALDLISSKTIEDDWALGTSFPYVTDEKGAWKTMRASEYASYSSKGWSHGNWFCGFWIGLLLIGYLHTRKKSSSNQRWIGCFSFPHVRTIQTLMISVSFLAERHSFSSDPRRSLGEGSRAALGRSIAQKVGDHAPRRLHRGVGSVGRSARTRSFATITRPFTPSNSNCRPVSSGAPSRFRGLGTTRFGRADRHGRSTERLAVRYFERLGNESVPWWDFDDPAIPHAPRDSSAAAIVCSALIDLAALHPDATTGEAWLTRSRATIELLCKDYLALGNAQRGILAHACYF